MTKRSGKGWWEDGRAVRLGLAALSVLASGACRQPETIREYFRDPTPHERYLLGLSQAGLTATALGQEWVRVSEDALDAPLVDIPYREEGFFPSEEPMAFGYRVGLERGQVLEVDVALDTAAATLLFVDLFRAAPDSTRRPVPVLHADGGGYRMEYEARRSGEYILRIQPELLRGGRFRVTLAVDPSLAFPVSGRDTRAIQSFFGDARDGGRRDHHGVDIFAPRGTPVVAAVGGYARVRTSNRGGRVVWLRDRDQNRSLYYAHLEEQLVRDGERVEVGDTLGRVGNSGNARTTPPHLHFGIYRRGEGPLNPWYFLWQPEGEMEAVQADLSRIGLWARTSTDLGLRDRPSIRGAVLRELPRHTAVRIVAGAGPWLRVRLPDGREGFVREDDTEGLDEPIRTEVAERSAPLQAQPRVDAPVMATLEAGRDVEVLGAFEDFLYAQPREGRPGWMPLSRQDG